MPNILDIKIQKLFLITVILKIGSAFLGWRFNSPWLLGFLFPIIVMAVYIALGVNRRDRDVTDEKFADSCYFLGFIFTIASIIFSLLDLPIIGDKIKDIAVRFGAAMVTTCFGLIVRVYLVNFKKNVDDVEQDVTDSIIEASRIFREQLVMASEKLSDFQSQVDTAAKMTIERVNIQVEKLSKDHAEKLTSFFAELTIRNQEAFTNALNEVKSASLRLSDSIDGYSQGLQKNLNSIEEKVTFFGDAVTERLKTTTFPDDYFARHLSTPLDQLKKATNDISLSSLQTSEEIAKSSIVLSDALKKLNTKAKGAENSLEAVIRLNAQQQAVLDVVQGQLTTLDKLGTTLERYEILLNTTVDSIKTSIATTSKLADRVDEIVVESTGERKQLESSLVEVVSKLGAQVVATDALSAHMDKNATVSQEYVIKLSDNARVLELCATQLADSVSKTNDIAEKVGGMTSFDAGTAQTLTTIAEKATLLISKIDIYAVQSQEIVKQLANLNTAIRSQRNEAQKPVSGIDQVPLSKNEAGPRWRWPFGPSKPPSSKS